MRNGVIKALGIILIVAAIGGLLFSLVGLGVVWSTRAQVIARLETSLSNISLTLENTADALLIADNSLKGTIKGVAALKTAIQKTADTINTSMGAVENVADLTQNSLPKTVEAAQNSLRSAQEAAKVVDNFLTTISGLPFIPDFYKPKTPLNEALGDVIDKLDAVPGSLRNIGDSVGTSGSQLKDFSTSFVEFPEIVQNIADNLQQAEGVIAQYQTMVTTWQSQVDVLRGNVRRIVNLSAVGLSLFLIWLVAVQLGLMVEGLRLLGVNFELSNTGDEPAGFSPLDTETALQSPSSDQENAVG